MEKIEINGELVLELKSKRDWINKVPDYLPPKSRTTVLLFVDKNGNVFDTGADFAAAEEQDSYPCKVYNVQLVSEVKDSSNA